MAGSIVSGIVKPLKASGFRGPWSARPSIPDASLSILIRRLLTKDELNPTVTELFDEFIDEDLCAGLPPELVHLALLVVYHDHLQKFLEVCLFVIEGYNSA